MFKPLFQTTEARFIKCETTGFATKLIAF